MPKTKTKKSKQKDKTKIQLVEKHDFLRGSEEFKKLDALCFASKNLYNSTLYKTRQMFFQRFGVSTFGIMCHELALNQDADYLELPAKVSQQVLKLVYDGWNSYFALCELAKQGLYDWKKVKIPKYLKSKTGRQVLLYTSQAVSVKNGFVTMSQTGVSIKTNVDKVQFVRVVPKSDRITVEVGYKNDLPKIKSTKNKKFSAIDIGQDNLAAVVFTDDKPYIINGRPIKSINHEFNKRNAELTSLRENRNPKDKQWTHQQNGSSRRRSNKIADYMHKGSRYLIDDLKKRGITDLIVGHNNEWKQEIELGKQTNQNFVSIPFNNFINDLVYKGALAGIRVHVIEESYTSQASFLDRDFIPTYQPPEPMGEADNADKTPAKPPKYKFSGRRVTRGLYKSKVSKKTLNADVNGALNILRKFFQERGEECPEFSKECVASPKILSFGVHRNPRSNHTMRRRGKWQALREKRRARFRKRLAFGRENVVPKGRFLACI